MRALTALRRTSLSHPLSPLFVDLTNETTTTETSYRSAYDAAIRHRELIEDEVDRCCRRCHPCPPQPQNDGATGHGWDDGGGAEAEAGGAVDVVVAYLCANRPDYLLSVLGCTDAFLGKDVAAAAAAASSSSSRSSSASTTTTPPPPTTTTTKPAMARARVARVRPALLSTRWTPDEIARALRVRGGGAKHRPTRGSRSRMRRRQRRHLTLMVSGPGFEAVGSEVASAINGDGGQRALGHRAAAVPLPRVVSAVAKFDTSSSAAAAEEEEASILRRRRPPHTLSSSRDRTSASGVGVGRGDDYGSYDADDAVILFTSGTASASGTAKGVRLSHRSLVVQAMAKLRPPCSYDSNTNVVASTVPFFHVGGLSSALAVVLAGGTLTFPPGPAAPRPRRSVVGFRPGAVLRALEPRRASGGGAMAEDPPPPPPSPPPPPANTLVVVPAMVHSLLLEVEGGGGVPAGARSAGASDDAEGRLGRTDAAAARRRYPHVRTVLVGGQSLSSSQLRRAREVFPSARFVQTYACTEAGSSVTFAELPSSPLPPPPPPPPPPPLPGSAGETVAAPAGDYVGIPPPHVEVGIFLQSRRRRRDDDEGDAPPSVARTPDKLRPSCPSSFPSSSPSPSAAPPYVVGIIGTRGPHVMNGYWQRGNEDDGATRGGRGAGIPPGGWFLTNDLGFYVDNDGGNGIAAAAAVGGGRAVGLHFCGRADDVIRTGGESVPAMEVERVLASHPDVDSCAVFGLPDGRFGQAVCAAIVLRRHSSGRRAISFGSGGGPEEVRGIRDEMRRHCSANNLAGYKRPWRVFVLDDLPRNSSGKVLKRRLVEMFGERRPQQQQEDADWDRVRSKL